MTTWILLRGLTRERGHWGRFPAALQARLPGARVVPLDFPGNGRHHRLRSPTRIPAMTDWCLEQTQALRLEPPYGLIAMSMGAMVAIDWAARAPRSLAGCVLINTSLRTFDPWFRRLRPAAWPGLLGLMLPGLSDAAREASIIRLTSRHPDAGAAVLADWVRLRREHPVSRSNALRQLCAAARFAPSAVPPEVAMLVLGSRLDSLVNVRCSLGLARRWETDLAIHPGAGHDLPLDDPAWVAEHIAQWARTKQSSPAAFAPRST